MKSSPLPQFLSPSQMALQLSEIELSYSGEGPRRITTQWFHGPVDADFYVWIDHNEQIIKQMVTLVGVVVEWNVLDGLRTGMVIEKEVSGGEASEEIRYDVQVNQLSLDLALQLVLNLASLKENLRHRVMAHFRGAPSTTPVDHLMNKIFSDLKPSRWEWMKDRLRRLLK